VKGKKLKSRVERRLKAWKNSNLKDKPGYKAPGSNKKCHPKGANR